MSEIKYCPNCKGDMKYDDSNNDIGIHICKSCGEIWEINEVSKVE